MKGTGEVTASIMSVIVGSADAARKSLMGLLSTILVCCYGLVGCV